MSSEEAVPVVIAVVVLLRVSVISQPAIIGTTHSSSMVLHCCLVLI